MVARCVLRKFCLPFRETAWSSMGPWRPHRLESSYSRPRNRTPSRCGNWPAADIKYHTVRVSDVAARDLRILLYYGTTGCDELPLGGFNVWHKKLKDRSMFLSLFNVKTK